MRSTLSVRRALGAALLLVATLPGCASLPLIGDRFRSHFWGFVVPWDARSAESAARNGGRLDAVVSGWTGLDTLTGRPVAIYPDSGGSAAGGRMMLVTTYAGDRFQTRVLLALAATPARRDAMAGELARLAERGGYRGLVLDFEGHSSADLGSLTAVVRAISDSAHRRGVAPIVVAVPATDTAAYPARALVAAGADLILVMLYDQHWAGSPPGPLAAPDWARQRLATRVAEVGASRLVVGLPLHGYHWRPDAPTDVVSYADAARIAAAAGLTLDREPASLTLRAVRPDSSQVWVADAVLLRTLVADAERAGVRRFSLWRLGLEDPAVWDDIAR